MYSGNLRKYSDALRVQHKIFFIEGTKNHLTFSLWAVYQQRMRWAVYKLLAYDVRQKLLLFERNIRRLIYLLDGLRFSGQSIHCEGETRSVRQRAKDIIFRRRGSMDRPVSSRPRAM